MEHEIFFYFALTMNRNYKHFENPRMLVERLRNFDLLFVNKEEFCVFLFGILKKFEHK